MKKLILAFLAFLSLAASAATVTFSQDTTTVIPNPERGWYLLAGDNGLLSSGSTFSNDLVTIRDTYGFRLALAETTIPTTLSGGNLTTMQTQLTNARNAGMKLIVRFKCGSTSGVSCDPTVPQVVAQASAIKAVLLANRDVIAYVQAGLLGVYGEWAEVYNGNDTKANKRTIKDAVLDMVPPEIPVQFTQVYPQMEDWYGTSAAPAAPLAATDVGGSKKARTGFHSDCLLTGNGDSYFYPGQTTISDFVISSSRTAQRNYVAAATEYVPFGGETCFGSAGSSVQIRTGCTSANDAEGNTGGIMNEGPRYHMTYLNNSYERPHFIDSWTAGGCYTQIENLLGYRIALDAVSHADTVTHGTTLVVTVGLHNYGWSRIFQQRRVTVTLVKSGATSIVCASSNDLRKLPSQTTTPTQQQIKCPIPSGATVGVYAMHLSMPDKTPALSAIRNYMVRPANATIGGQIWDNTLGRFATGTTVTVN